ncbi:hypothetical protein ALT717_20094 [Alteromonas macleodii]|tara:strand:- start:24683 stop:24850 length:168 start_codon:yes stop_codon:yes gene_type:complete
MYACKTKMELTRCTAMKLISAETVLYLLTVYLRKLGSDELNAKVATTLNQHIKGE